MGKKTDSYIEEFLTAILKISRFFWLELNTYQINMMKANQTFRKVFFSSYLEDNQGDFLLIEDYLLE